MGSDQCQICLMPEAAYVENKVTKKDLSHEQAAKELAVDLPKWLAHYELHIRNKLVNAIAKDIEPMKIQLLDKIQEAKSSMERLIGTTQQIHKLLENKDNQMNTRLISAYASLEKNVITGVKELAILEGDITNATQINIQHNEIKIDKLMSIVMEDATPAQQTKILKKLEEIKFAD